MAQRGTLRIAGSNFFGYWNDIVIDPSTGEKKRKQRCVKLGPKSLGKKKAYELLADEIKRSVGNNNGRHRPDSSVTLEWYTRNRWLPTKEASWRSHTDAKGRTVNPAKDNANESLAHIFKTFGSTPLEELDSVALQKWLNEIAKKHSDSVVKHCRYFLKAILKFAVWEDYLIKNSAEYLVLPQTKPVDKTVLTPDQFSAVMAELDTKHSLLVRIGVFCAFRPSELLALRWRDFDSKGKVFYIRETLVRGVLRPFTKTTDANSPEQHLLTVAIPEPLVKELVQYRNRGQINDAMTAVEKLTALAEKNFWRGDDDFIFCTHKGTPITKENVQHRLLTPIRQKLNLLKLNFQVLRRTMATLSQHKGSVKDIQSVLRHKSPDITAEVYMQPISESARQMVNDVYAQLTKKKAQKRPSASVRPKDAKAGV